MIKVIFIFLQIFVRKKEILRVILIKVVKNVKKYNTIAFYKKILYNLSDLRKMSKKGRDNMITIAVKLIKNNKIIYSHNDSSDIIPANTTYLSLHKFYN